MTSTSLSLALRIAQLVEENSEAELQEAVALLEKYGTRSHLLDYFARRKAHNRNSQPKGQSSRTQVRLDDTPSRTVLRLRESDPDKFRLLSEFSLLLRRGQVLSTLEDLKSFGERISKDFQSRDSRKKTVSALLSVLAQLPLEEIEKLIEFAATFGVAGGTDEYQRLAQFLIKGKRTDEDQEPSKDVSEIQVHKD